MAEGTVSMDDEPPSFHTNTERASQRIPITLNAYNTIEARRNLTLLRECVRKVDAHLNNAQRIFDNVEEAQFFNIHKTSSDPDSSHASGWDDVYATHGDPSAIEQDWCGRGFDAQFLRNEQLPLEHIRTLGYGLTGEVVQVTCKGINLALKKIWQRQGPKDFLKKEIEVLKDQSHHHIVRLVGTYFQSPYLGLLIWPVAHCDLAHFLTLLELLKDHPQSALFSYRGVPSFMEETPQDALDISPSEAEQKTAKRRMAVQEIFDEHDMKKEDFDLMLERWKNSLFCCLTSAVAYLHEKNIRHKDIKPSNVLLSPHGMWLTDFGTAKDFTKSLTSTSESRERGTLRYCAPEVAQYEPSGRSADIFSLGCVFLEFLVATSPWSSLADLEVLCPLKNRSYEANLDRLDDWLRLLEDGYSESREDSTPHIALELRQMLNADRFMRPTARRLVWQWADPHVTRADAPNRCSKCQQWAGQFFSEPRLWEEMTEYITSGTRFLAASIEEQLSNGNPHDFNNPHDPDDPEDIFEDLQRRLDQLRR